MDSKGIGEMGAHSMLNQTETNKRHKMEFSQPTCLMVAASLAVLTTMASARARRSALVIGDTDTATKVREKAWG